MRPRTRRVGRRDEPPHAPPGPPRRIRPAGPALASMGIVAVLAAGCAGCGADTATPGDPPPSTPASSAPTATDPPATAAPTTTTTAAISGDEAEVRATIDRYWAAWFAATANPPDPDNAELNAVLIGEAKMRIIGGVQRRLNDGRFVRLPKNTEFSRTTMSIAFDQDGVADVEECVVDDTELVDMSTGEIVEGSLATTRLRLTLKEYPEGWKITTSATVSTAEGSIGCDA